MKIELRGRALRQGFTAFAGALVTAALVAAAPAAADSTKDVIVANTAQNPVPVSFQQSAPWLVTFVGQPTVALVAGTSVKLDPTANTVKLDPGANTVKLDPGANTVKLDPSANVVQIANATLDVRSTESTGQHPFQNRVVLSFEPGSSSTYALFQRPPGKRVVVTHISARAEFSSPDERFVVEIQAGGPSAPDLSGTQVGSAFHTCHYSPGERLSSLRQVTFRCPRSSSTHH